MGYVRALLAGCVGLTLGCPGLAPYICELDSDCNRAGLDGWCLDDGACAYEDSECELGRRSDNAAVAPGACVSEGGGGTGTGTGSDDQASQTGQGPGTDDDDDDDDGPSACGSQIAITLNTGVLTPGESVAGLPVLIRIEDGPTASAIADSGTALRFIDDRGDVLPADVETLDPDRFEAWVRLPSYEAGEPLSLVLRWGTADAAPDPSLVWADNYVGVWHLSDAPTGADGAVMANAANATEPGLTVGAMAANQSVAGLVGNGLLFDGDDDSVEVFAAFIGTLDSYTVSWWARYDGNGEETFRSYFARLNGDVFWPRCWRLDEVDWSGTATCQYQIDGMTSSLGSGEPHAEGETIHMALVRDADAQMTYLYRGGELVNEVADPPGPMPTDDLPLQIGRGEWGSYFGMIDEFRVSAGPLPAGWIEADYRMVTNPGSIVLEQSAIENAPCDD